MAKGRWNHVPEDVPIRVMPLWQWPPRPGEVLRWYWNAWLPVSFNLAMVAVSFAFLYGASPTLEVVAAPGVWILGFYLRNAILLTLLAEGLHRIFHRHGLQGRDHKYDPRPFPRKGGTFSFGDQYRDNVFWSLASGAGIWTAYEALVLWAMANGLAPIWTWDDGAVWFVAIFFLVPVWESFYFYWIHRILHSRPFYRFHALHHRNTDIGPWSGLSMHPVEHLMFFGTALIHFVVPTHPVHVIFHLMFYGLYPAITHTGFEGLWAGGRKRLHLGMFHHQLHHRYFEVNYGTLEVPWDKVFGTFHDGTEAAQDRMKDRLRELHRKG